MSCDESPHFTPPSPVFIKGLKLLLNEILLKIAARKIVEHRSKNGNFEKVEQLLDLDKIETVTLEKYCREAFFHIISQQDREERDIGL